MERRENYLEDQSELNLLKQGKVSPTDFFNYYLGNLQPEHPTTSTTCLTRRSHSLGSGG